MLKTSQTVLNKDNNVDNSSNNSIENLYKNFGSKLPSLLFYFHFLNKSTRKDIREKKKGMS